MVVVYCTSELPYLRQENIQDHNYVWRPHNLEDRYPREIRTDRPVVAQHVRQRSRPIQLTIGGDTTRDIEERPQSYSIVKKVFQPSRLVLLLVLIAAQTPWMQHDWWPINNDIVGKIYFPAIIGLVLIYLVYEYLQFNRQI